MKIVIKGAIILLVACLLLVAAGCGGEEGEANQIRIGVLGPMTLLMGDQMWMGAQLAAEEINAAGGIKVGDEWYLIKPIKYDTNEYVNVPDAVSAAERAITIDKVHSIVGTMRTEAIRAIQEISADNELVYLSTGSPNTALTELVLEDYDRYKYYFRPMPMNTGALGQVQISLLQMVAQEIRDLGIETPKVAVLCEKTSAGDALAEVAEQLIPLLGMEVAGIWRPSTMATEVTAELAAVEASGAQIIFTLLAGPVGIPYAREWGERGIPAASVGVNVEAEKQGFWDVTEGMCEYDMTVSTHARVKITDETIPFIDKFEERFEEPPTGNAGTYDVMYILKEAIERAGTLDADAVVAELEQTEHTGPFGKIVFDDKHDVIWGPGYVTYVGVQWQDGELKCVWPPSDGSWQGVVYEGTVEYMLPPRVIEKWGP